MQGNRMVYVLSRCLIWLPVSVLLNSFISSVSSASTWTDRPLECVSVLPKNYRCHWPDENFNCECVEGAACHDEDHYCVCHIGLTGDRCDQPCAYPRNTPNPSCHRNCRETLCTRDETCEQQTLLCACLPGYSGPDCNWCDPSFFNSEKCGKCPTHVCQNGGKCDILANECVCPEGYFGPPDRNDCSYCDPSIHPNRCLEHCDYDCNQGVCDTTKRMCHCPNKAIHGYDCSLCIPSEMPDNCTMYCHGYCLEGGYCNITQKQCICLPGLYGQFCEYCNQTAQPVKCKDYCSIDCKYGTCSVRTGKCECDRGYSRADCGLCRPSDHPQKCRNHCSNECLNGDCIVSSGVCQCAPGLIGENCRMCDPVVHDQNCLNHCKHECQQGSSCDTVTGLCECLPGWTGSACNNSCPYLFFGINCSQNCHCEGGPCDAVSGECIIEEKPPTTSSIITTKSIPIKEKVTSKSSTKSMYELPANHKGDGYIIVKPPADASSSAPSKRTSTILLLALLACLLSILVIVAVVVVLRKHQRKKQIEHKESVPEEVPLNNLVVPVPDSGPNDGEGVATTLESPLVPPMRVPESVDGLYTTIDDHSSRPNSILMMPNPRKSTNLDAEAQRLFIGDTGEHFFLGKHLKTIPIQKNIFDEKEALTKDKLKRANVEEPLEQLKKEAEEEVVKEGFKDNRGSKEVHFEMRNGTIGSRRGANTNQDKHTDSGFCDGEPLEGAVGGSDLLTAPAPPTYERLESGNESTSTESLSNSEIRSKTPRYSEISFDTKKPERTADAAESYQHLNRLDNMLDSDPDITLKNPRYSKLKIPVSVPKGYSHLEHGPKRKEQPEKRLLDVGEYASLQRDESKDSGDED